MRSVVRSSGRSLLLAGMTIMFVGCDFIGPCTSELRPNLRVEVRAQGTSAAAAQGATGTAEHRDGDSTDLTAADSLRLFGDFGRERAGRYSVLVRKPGYDTVTANTEVSEDACHVNTRTVRVELATDSQAIRQTPILHANGVRVRGSSASAGIRVFGDTLEIVGAAPAPCSELRPVAFRRGREWHIQLEPSLSAAWSCSNTLENQQ